MQPVPASPLAIVGAGFIPLFHWAGVKLHLHFVAGLLVFVFLPGVLLCKFSLYRLQAIEKSSWCLETSLFRPLSGMELPSLPFTLFVFIFFYITDNAFFSDFDVLWHSGSYFIDLLNVLICSFDKFVGRNDFPICSSAMPGPHSNLSFLNVGV